MRKIKQHDRPYLIRKGDRLYDCASSLERAIARVQTFGRGTYTIWLRGEPLQQIVK